MNEQPEALRLADALDELDAQFTHPGLCGEAAAELRRLHAKTVEADQVIEQRNAMLSSLHALNAELLEVLKRARVVINDTAYGGAVFRKEVRDVMDAIAKATGEQA